LRHAEEREEREGDDAVQQLTFASFALNAGGGDLHQDPQDTVKWSTSTSILNYR